MKTTVSVAFVATLAVLLPNPTRAQRVPCSGPLAHCFTAVGAFCEREPDGRIRTWYADRSNYGQILEECIGKVFEAHGRPNPYRPASPQQPAPRR